MSDHLTVRKGPHDLGTAYILWLAGLFGVCGIHRFYMGRWMSGILWLCTGGLCGVGQVIDLFLMRTMVRDSNRGAGW